MPLRLQNVLACLVILALSFLLIFRDAYHASHIETYPDAVEYVSMAVNFLNQGTTQIDVDGQFYPSRYAPWFSLTVLAPVLLLFGMEPGNSIYGVFLLNLIGLLFGYILLTRVLAPMSALVGILVLFLIPDFTYNAQLIMNDVPSALIFMICSYLFINDQKLICSNRKWAVAIGSLIALATLWRITNVFLVLPFLLVMKKDFKKDFQLRLIFILPLVLALGLNFIHNYQTFHSIFRNGYNYWTSIPYDYPSLTFNWSNLSVNLAALGTKKIYLVICVAFLGSLILHYWKARDLFKAQLLFVLVGTLPVLLFYLFYFYFDFRFYLPVVLVMIGSSVLTLRYCPPVFSSLILIAILSGIYWQMEEIPHRNRYPQFRKNVDALKSYTEENSIVLTNLNLPYLKLYFTNDRRRFIPISRNAEYADKIIMPWKHPSLKLSEIEGPLQHRHQKLVATGIEPIKYIFLEKPNDLLAILPNQIIYLDLFSIPENIAVEYYRQVNQYCDLILISPGIFRLQARN